MYCTWRGRLCEPIDLLARILESLPLVLVLRSLSIKSFAIKTCHSPTQLSEKPSPSLLLFPLAHITLAFLTLHRQEKMDSGGSKRTCFIEEDDGLASVADMEAGFSGNHSQNNNNNNNYALFSRPLSYARSSLKNLSTSSPSSVCFSPRSGGARFYDARFEEQLPHFLDACFLCKKPLGNRDIYMYRGDVPFCSEECRQEKMDEDEAKEKKLSLSSTIKALRKKSTSPTRNQDYSYRTSTVAAA